MKKTMGPTKVKISRTKAKDIIMNSKGRFITTTHITENGVLRTMNCRYKNQTSLGKLRVIENGKYKAVNPATLKELKANKVVYIVR
ncbi:MAG: hypothetical protein ACEQSQ_06140 [Candidatus Paceibacteria bacterium]